MPKQKTIIFWGAGATASLGIQTTDKQAKALQILASSNNRLEERVAQALSGAHERWKAALVDLLTILGDYSLSGTDTNLFTITDYQTCAMERHWECGASKDALRNRMISLRLLYDWPALKSIIDLCPGVPEGNLKLNDLFNLLDMHGQSGHGFRDEYGSFLSPQRVLSANNALRMLQQTMLYIGWQSARTARRTDLGRHYGFAEILGRRMQGRGRELGDCGVPFDSHRFYMGDVSFASLNWDPIGLWCQFVANRDLNRMEDVPKVGVDQHKLRIYHDLGHFVPGHRVLGESRDPDETPWHPMNESSARQLNDEDHGASIRVRITKFLLPHGCLWWRECPNCGKLSSYMGDTWDRGSETLIPPPPLAGFVEDVQFTARNSSECDAWREGKVDARACVHCGTLTYAHHTAIIVQSSFKRSPPPFLEEIKRDLRVAVQEAGHVVLLGYSLPTDDVDYRAFFAARRQRGVKCSVVVGTKNDAVWAGPSEWPAMLKDMEKDEAPRTTLEAARDLFGENSVRFYGGGIPNVFLEGGRVTEFAVEELLTWR